MKARVKHRLSLITRQIFILVCLVAILGGTIASPVMAAELSFNTSASDGYLWAYTDSDYATTRTKGTAEAIQVGYTFTNIGQELDSGWYYIWRSYLYFDTSGLPDDAIISSAVLKLYGKEDKSTTDFDIVIQSGMPTYPTDPLVTSDYDYTFYSGDGGSINTSEFTTSDYNYISLSETGMGWINVEGYTKFALRSSRDINGDAPTGDESVIVWSYEYEEYDDGHWPELDITYTLPEPPPSTPAGNSILELFLLPIVAIGIIIAVFGAWTKNIYVFISGIIMGLIAFIIIQKLLEALL